MMTLISRTPSGIAQNLLDAIVPGVAGASKIVLVATITKATIVVVLSSNNGGINTSNSNNNSMRSS